MLNVDEIMSDYPERLRGFKENILKEYLQHRILDIVFGSNPHISQNSCCERG